jgi:hypothetical protein
MVGWPIHIDPHVGSLSNKVKLSEATASLGTVSNIIHLSAREPRRTPRKPLQTTMNRHAQSGSPLAV